MATKHEKKDDKKDVVIHNGEEKEYDKLEPEDKKGYLTHLLATGQYAEFVSRLVD